MDVDQILNLNSPLRGDLLPTGIVKPLKQESFLSKELSLFC